MNFLEIQNVTKRFDQHVAVNGASLSVPKGKIFGLLGPNGAGKTTIIRMITGITVPDDGAILFDGQPLSAHHSNEVGYMPEERGLYKKTKIREQIMYLLNLRGMTDAQAAKATDEWLDRLGLSDWANKPASDLSKGMQQKAQFIATVAHKPKLLILDEPFSGLDPVNAQVIERTMMELKAEGTTIIFSTHRLEQVEEFCDNIALVHRGQVILEGEVVEVRKRFQKQRYQVLFLGELAPVEAAIAPVGTFLKADDQKCTIILNEGQTGKALLQALAQVEGTEILSVTLDMPRLNDIFIELVGETAANPVMKD